MSPSRIRVAINNQQQALPVSQRALQQLARKVLAGEGIASAVISVAIVDDATMHQLNKRFLNHDYTTDVLSFLLESDEDSLEGEIIISAETAVTACAAYDTTPEQELLLYLVHGLLHLVGYDDHSDEDRAEMRAKEQEYLGRR